MNDSNYHYGIEEGTGRKIGKVCPHCGSTKVRMYGRWRDECVKCMKNFPAVSTQYLD